MATMPLNAAERAVKLHRRFWMAHTGSEKRFLIPYLVVLIGSNFAIGLGIDRQVVLGRHAAVDDLPDPEQHNAPAPAAVVPVVQPGWRRTGGEGRRHSPAAA